MPTRRFIRHSLSTALTLAVFALSSVIGMALPAESRHADWVTVAGLPVASGNPMDATGRIREVPSPVLRLMRTQSPKPLGVVLVLPGGGYVHLAADKEGTKTAAFLNAHGFDAAVLEYPIAPGGRASRDSALVTARAAWNLLRKDADALGLRPGRRAIMGYSAGGHLAARLVQSLPPAEQPDALLLVYPAYLDESRQPTTDPAVVPPTAPHRLFLVIARDDHPAWVKSSEAYAKAWIARGGHADWSILADGGHGFGITGRKSGASKDWSLRLAAFLISVPDPHSGNEH